MIKDLKPGTKVKLNSLENEAHQTKPPARFSEVKLIAELEKRGIGRPATFNSIVTTIQERGYVMRKGNQLAPTFLGFAVVGLLRNKFPEFTSYDYTSAMEEKLDDVATGKTTREKFLNDFWNGQKGFHAKMEKLLASIDFDEIRKLSTVELHNGYSIIYNKFGAWLQDDNGVKNDKGYLPSVRLDDNELAEDYLDAEKCKTTFESAKNRVDARELGVLKAGEYAGWTVTARDGKFGAFVQALHPDVVEALAKDKKPPAKAPKPINQGLPEDADLATVTLEDIAPLFAEVKLPRTLSPQLFTGIGKRGPWLGWKATAKSRRAVFVSLPEGMDPRTITVEEAQKVWDDKQEAKNAKAKK